MKTRPGIVLLTALLVAGGPLSPIAVDAAWRPFAKKQGTEEARPAGDPTTVAQADVSERLNRAEARIRELTGQVQELDYKLRQIEQELGIKPGEGAVMAAPDAETGAVPVEPEPSGRLVIDAPVAADQPIDLTAPGAAPRAAEGDGRAKTQVVSLGDPRADYERAYSSILSGDYELAEAAFRNFLATYPADDRAPDAQYWLGESLFARGQYSEAADAFLAGYKAYPTSAKAADTLLKLGLALAGLGEREAACSTYTEVLRKFPNSSNALRQRVESEQSVAGC
ncbi:MAG: tol-pal system protein YbgF [Bauldia sp.]|uniref:tol-pal system protein YbgF n=1 Tax=Bauldia sp. TaxID=2575872 RepID=UPI001D1BCE3B|nr:tol-pal system protein YbgF [Bauldia sp.]MCB1496153.1 tol-pal system protein YbgF [Bauldia sp.]